MLFVDMSLVCKSYLILMSRQLVDEETKREEHMHPFIGSPSHHGSQVHPQHVTTIDDWHEKKELASYNDPRYSNIGELFWLLFCCYVAFLQSYFEYFVNQVSRTKGVRTMCTLLMETR